MFIQDFKIISKKGWHKLNKKYFNSDFETDGKGGEYRIVNRYPNIYPKNP